MGQTAREPGHELYTLWSAAAYAVDRSDWLLRLLKPPENHGNANSEGGVSTEAAEAALVVRLGLANAEERDELERTRDRDDILAAADRVPY